MDSRNRLILLKVSGENLSVVMKERRYATNRAYRLEPGDLILFAENRSTLTPGERSIRYCMEYAGTRLDEANESDRLWGKHWKYIIDGRNVRQLSEPFDMRTEQVSKKNYQQAGPAYLDDEDVAALKSKGLL